MLLTHVLYPVAKEPPRISNFGDSMLPFTNPAAENLKSIYHIIKLSLAKELGNMLFVAVFQHQSDLIA